MLFSDCNAVSEVLPRGSYHAALKNRPHIFNLITAEEDKPCRADMSRTLFISCPLNAFLMTSFVSITRYPSNKTPY